MKIGIVCPYAYDVPGGVQFHVRDQAEELRRRGHEVSVFAPVETEYSEDGFVNAGKTFARNLARKSQSLRRRGVLCNVTKMGTLP